MWLWLVETQVKTFEVARGAIGDELIKIGAAIPNLSDDSGAIVSTQVVEPVKGFPSRLR
jgi:hypothetical protein